MKFRIDELYCYGIEHIEQDNIIMRVCFFNSAHSVIGVLGHVVVVEEGHAEGLEGNLKDLVALLPEVLGVPLVEFPGFPDEFVDEEAESGSNEDVKYHNLYGIY